MLHNKHRRASQPSLTAYNVLTSGPVLTVPNNQELFASHASCDLRQSTAIL